MGEWENKPRPGVASGIEEVGSGIAGSLNNMQAGLTDLNGLLGSLVDAAQTTSSITPIDTSTVSFQSQITSINNGQQNSDAEYNAIITKTLTVPPDSTESVGEISGAVGFSYDLPEMPPMLSFDANFSSPPSRPTVQFNTPATPSLSTTSDLSITPPASASIGSVSGMSIGSAPVLSASPPSLANISAPSSFNKSAPTSQPLSDHALPSAPVDDIPNIPALHDITLPPSPVLTAITFDGVLPSPIDNPPDVDFNFVEIAYGSAINTAIKDKFISYIMNYERTSLMPSIEQQLWDKAREQQAKLVKKSSESIKRSHARAGWGQPTGGEIESIFAAMEEASELDIAESRKITETQNKLEQSNFQLAVGKALEYEGQLIELHNNVQQRSLEAAKFVIEAAISLYETKISYINANILLYTTQADVYEGRIKAEISKLEIYKAQLEGQKLIGELNRQDIALYKAQIDAVVATFDLYKSKLMGVKIQIEGDSLKVQNFGVAIKAFAAEIKAKSLEFDGYATALSGEEIKTKVYNSLVSAYSKQVGAYKAEVGAMAKKLDADIKVNINAPIEISDQELRKFSAVVDAEMSRIDVISSQNKNAVKLFAAEIDGESARTKSEVAIYKEDVEAFKSVVESNVDQAAAYNETNKTTAKIYETQVSAEADVLKAIVGLDRNRIEAFNIAVKRSAAVGMAGAEYNQINVSAYEASNRATIVNTRTKAEIKNAEAMVVGAQLREQVAKARSDVMQAVAANARSAQAAIASMQISAQLSAAIISIHNFSDSKTWTLHHGYSHDDYSSGTHVSRTTVRSE